jgi:hypothetical protein
MVKKNQKSPKHGLLVAGGKDFLRASAAIAKFGNVIVETTDTVLKSRAPRVKEATGLILNTNKITTTPKWGYVYDEQDGTNAEIGSWAPLGSGHNFSLYVWWRIDDQQQEARSVIVQLECNNRESADDLDVALQGYIKSTITREGNVFWIQKLIEPREFINLKRHFEAVFDEWITCAKAIGGLKKYLKS